MIENKVQTSERDDISTPQNWHWKITPNQIEKIKKGDVDTVNQVWQDNFVKFRRISINLSKQGHISPYDYEDILSNMYLLLFTADYTNCKTFFHSLVCSRYFSKYRNVFVSLDELGTYKDEDGKALIDCLEYDPTITQGIGSADDTSIISFLDAQIKLTAREKNLLYAIAIGSEIKNYTLYKRW